jgi:hypothetical protein
MRSSSSWWSQPSQCIGTSEADCGALAGCGWQWLPVIDSLRQRLAGLVGLEYLPQRLDRYGSSALAGGAWFSRAGAFCHARERANLRHGAALQPLGTSTKMYGASWGTGP